MLVPDPVPCIPPEPSTIPSDVEMGMEDSQFQKSESVNTMNHELLEEDDELNRDFEQKLAGKKYWQVKNIFIDFHY